MPDFSDLALPDMLSLCRLAQHLSLRFLERISRSSESRDSALQKVLADIGAQVREQARTLEDHESVPSAAGASRLERAQGENLLRGYLSSLFRRLGEGTLHRDIAMFFAESLKEESFGFYRALAEHAPDWGTRNVLVGLSEQEGSALRQLREVVLQG